MMKESNGLISFRNRATGTTHHLDADFVRANLLTVKELEEANRGKLAYLLTCEGMFVAWRALLLSKVWSAAAPHQNPNRKSDPELEN